MTFMKVYIENQRPQLNFHCYFYINFLFTMKRIYLIIINIHVDILAQNVSFVNIFVHSSIERKAGSNDMNVPLEE